MFSIPVTFVPQFGNADERMRKFLLHEFADAGAKHLVLSSELIKAITCSWILNVVRPLSGPAVS